MRKAEQSRVIGLLGVGFDQDDGHIRITQADQYQVLMGSQASHQALQQICGKIEKTIQSSGRSLTDYSPDEFMELVETLY